MNKTLRTLPLLMLLLWTCQSQEVLDDIDLEELTIHEIHVAYKKGEMTAESLTKAYISRIESFDSATNAISIINPQAVAIAKALDEELKSTGKLRPLHGIPMIVKDNINTVGLPTTAGALALANFVPNEDAPIIGQLVDAGAIILAKSNMAEWAFSPMHTNSSTQGTTRNPYDLERVPAGSSGGTGAAVAANMGTIGLGTDTGNSIRGPSAHNALVGFRTTLGLISRTGIVPLYLGNDVVGPMCRTVEDATRVMEVMVGQDPKDPLTAYSEGKVETNYQQFLDKNGLKKARIGVLADLTQEMDAEIKVLFEQAQLDLESLGAEVIKAVSIPEFNQLRRGQWCSSFEEDVEAFLAEYVQNDTISTLADIARIGSNSAYAREGVNSFLTNAPEGGLGCENAYTAERRVAFREAIENIMDELSLDALIYPSWNYKPAHVDKFQEEYRGDNSQIISPHTGQPAFTVPMGFTEASLPAGLQFLGRIYDEPTLIRLTYAYEQGTLHRQPPVLK